MNEALEQRARQLLSRYPRPSGALMPLIDLVLTDLGACEPEAARWIAGLTGLSAAAVAGIASSRGGGRSAEGVRVCAGLSCRLMGGDEVDRRLRERLGDLVIPVPCLGVCSAAPAFERGGRLFEGLTPARLDDLVSGEAT